MSAQSGPRSNALAEGFRAEWPADTHTPRDPLAGAGQFDLIDRPQLEMFEGDEAEDPNFNPN